MAVAEVLEVSDFLPSLLSHIDRISPAGGYVLD